MAQFSQINKMSREAQYQTNQDWNGLHHVLKRYLADGLDLDPDFQRGHVWSEEQKIAYVEYKLRGGHGSHEIRFNCTNWMNHRGGAHKDFVIVDGKQRLSAVLDFLDDKIKAFGHLYSEYEDKHFLNGIDFIFKVNNLATKSDVLRWYLDINNSGTPHSVNEIQRVREMLDHEESKPQQADKPKKPKP